MRAGFERLSRIARASRVADDANARVLRPQTAHRAALQGEGNIQIDVTGPFHLAAMQHHGGQHRCRRLVGLHFSQGAAPHRNNQLGILGAQRAGQFGFTVAKFDNPKSVRSQSRAQTLQRLGIGIHAGFIDHYDCGVRRRERHDGQAKPREEGGYSHTRHTSFTKTDRPSPGRRSIVR